MTEQADSVPFSEPPDSDNTSTLTGWRRAMLFANAPHEPSQPWVFAPLVMSAGAFSTEAWAWCNTEKHLAPAWDCKCGFNAFTSREEALKYLAVEYPVGLTALLEVEGAGRVVEHELGWRSEWQRVLSVRFPATCHCGQPAQLWQTPRRVIATACDEHRHTIARPVTIEEARRWVGTEIILDPNIAPGKPLNQRRKREMNANMHGTVDLSLFPGWLRPLMVVSIGLCIAATAFFNAEYRPPAELGQQAWTAAQNAESGELVFSEESTLVWAVGVHDTEDTPSTTNTQPAEATAAVAWDGQRCVLYQPQPDNTITSTAMGTLPGECVNEALAVLAGEPPASDQFEM